MLILNKAFIHTNNEFKTLQSYIVSTSINMIERLAKALNDTATKQEIAYEILMSM